MKQTEPRLSKRAARRLELLALNGNRTRRTLRGRTAVAIARNGSKTKGVKVEHTNTPPTPMPHSNAKGESHPSNALSQEQRDFIAELRQRQPNPVITALMQRIRDARNASESEDVRE